MSEADANDKIELQKQLVLASVADARLTTVQTKVAWLLNHLPETRNSDILLMLKYWEQFCSDIYRGGPIHPSELFRLPRLTTISRARATIQNTLGLYVADEEIRRRRGTLEEETHDEQVRARNVQHSFSVYIDESGKTGDYLIVGSCWLLNGIESRAITRKIDAWREQSGFDQELHFVDIGRGNLHHYMAALDVFAEHAAGLSFKSIALQRRGIRDLDGALADMMLHLIVRGVKHEQESGRAILPRSIQVWKDAENHAQDRLALANLKERLNNARVAEFDDELLVGEMMAQDSRTNPFLQFADLFVSSTNRRIHNPEATGEHPKDAFAIAFLNRFGAQRTQDTHEVRGDVILFEDV
jgi:hypothetical protein